MATLPAPERADGAADGAVTRPLRRLLAEPEALVVPVLLAAVLVATTSLRQVLSFLPGGIEGDGPGLLSDASSLGGGIGGLSPHRAPGYPSLIHLLGSVGVDPFRAGTALSCAAGVALLPLSYLVATRLFDRRTARWAVLLVGSSALLITSASSVNADMLFAALFTAAVLPLLGADGHGPRRMALAGALGGLGFLVRHEGLALLLLVALRGLAAPRGRRGATVSLGVACFALAASPLLVASGLRFGDPLPSGLPPTVADAAAALGGNVLDALRRLVTDLHVLPIGLLAAMGVLALGGRRHVWALGALALCVVASTTTKGEARHLLAALPLLMPFAAAQGLELVDRRVLRSAAPATGARLRFWGPTVLAAGLLASAVHAGAGVLRAEDPHHRQVGRALRAAVPAGDDGPFASVDAHHIGYYAGMSGLPLGPSRLGNPTRGVAATHAALYAELVEGGARTLLVHERVAQTHPELAHLMDPRRAPPFLEPLATSCSPHLVVYQLVPGEGASGVGP